MIPLISFKNMTLLKSSISVFYFAKSAYIGDMIQGCSWYFPAK